MQHCAGVGEQTDLGSTGQPGHGAPDSGHC